jgi:hypothetical protein
MNRAFLALKSSPEQEAALEQLLADQQDPSSPRYHQWLSPQEFGARFGATPDEITTVTGWLQSHGFAVNSVANGGREIEFSGSARQMEQAFHTEIHEYDLDGETRIANSTDIAIPVALSPVVAGVVSLNNFPVKSHLRAKPQYTCNGGVPCAGAHGIVPYDFATVYNVLPLWNTQGIDGTGQSIAIPAQSNITLSDVTTFRNQYGLPANSPTIILNGADPGILSTTGDQDETTLDTEWSGGVAKGATIKVVVSKTTNTNAGAYLSMQYIVDNNVAPIVSMSYGFCEKGLGSTATMQYFGATWQQAATQGQSVFVAAGDAGSADCDAGTSATQGFSVDGVASSPYDVAVGGTEFNEGGNSAVYWNSTNNTSNSSSAKGPIPEVVWNDAGSQLSAGGGGVSMYWSTPTWQTGPGVPTSDPGAPTQHHRYVPDVSLSASASHDGYCLRLKSQTACGYGGTSATAPAFAGIMALVNQKTGQANGNPNPRLYAIANQTPSVFHDVSSGTNAVSCTVGTPNCSNSGVLNGYNAAAGYDLASGWGSVDVTALASAWAGTALPVQITTSSVAGGALGASYAASLVASSGTPPYTWSLVSGTLPPGVTLNPAGYFSGQPTASGTYNVTVQVTDSNGSTATMSLQLVFAATASATANTYHVFPRFVNGPPGDGTTYHTTLMISNPSDSLSSNCTLKLWSGGQQIVNSDLGSSYSLPPGGWVIASTTGGQTFQQGYATLQCTANVEAQLLYSLYNSGGVKTAEATVFSSPPASSVRILADETGGASLGLAVANDSDLAVNYTVTAESSNGAVLGTGTFAVGPRSATAAYLNQFLSPSPDPLAGLAGGGQVLVSSSNGTASAIGLRYSGPATSPVFTTVPESLASSVGASANSYHVFPRYADGILQDGTGASYQTTRMYVNPNASTTAKCTTNLRLTNPTTPITATVTPNFAVISPSSNSSSFQGGYASLSCTATDGVTPVKVDAETVYSEFNANGNKIGEATVFSSPGSARMQILADSRDGSRLGLAIANDSDASSVYQIAVYDASGNLLAPPQNLTIPARMSVANYIDQFVPGLPANYAGAVIVSSNTGMANIIGLKYPPAPALSFTTIPATVR